MRLMSLLVVVVLAICAGCAEFETQDSKQFWKMPPTPKSPGEAMEAPSDFPE